MIKIKPNIEHISNCPYCGSSLLPKDTLWQGIHICAVSECSVCKTELIEDLKVGHAIFYPYQVDLKRNKIFGSSRAMSWFGLPFLESLKNPDISGVEFKVERFFEAKSVIILNCIDFLYGHALLKLLNADYHIKNHLEFGLIILVPEFLRWMVPDGVAEVWTVNISLKVGRRYYPKLDGYIKKECERFERVFASDAHSHPKYFSITKFTGIERYRFSYNPFRIAFIWREDRPWINGNTPLGFFRRTCMFPILYWQNFKIRRLFSLLRRDLPNAIFTVAGLGKKTSFPQWIDDRRVCSFTPKVEREVCRIYSESRLVVGVHGSNMLLPSAHAGMTIDLMPEDRWGNFAQDILYQEEDSRLSSYIYRYLPIGIGVNLLSKIVRDQLDGYEHFERQMRI